MAKNTGNLNAGTDSLALARQDLYDMATDIGYKETGNVSPISTTGGNNKIVKTDASGNTRNIKTEDKVLINVPSIEALNVQNGAGTSVFNVDTVTNTESFSEFGSTYHQNKRAFSGTTISSSEGLKINVPSVGNRRITSFNLKFWGVAISNSASNMQYIDCDIAFSLTAGGVIMGESKTSRNNITMTTADVTLAGVSPTEISITFDNMTAGDFSAYQLIVESYGGFNNLSTATVAVV